MSTRKVYGGVRASIDNRNWDLYAYDWAQKEYNIPPRTRMDKWHQPKFILNGELYDCEDKQYGQAVGKVMWLDTPPTYKPEMSMSMNKAGALQLRKELSRVFDR